MVCYWLSLHRHSSSNPCRQVIQSALSAFRACRVEKGIPVELTLEMFRSGPLEHELQAKKAHMNLLEPRDDMDVQHHLEMLYP